MLVKENPGKYKLVPEGSHLAICFGIIDLGTQESVYKGETKHLRQVLLLWELHGEDQDGQPLQIEDGRPLSIRARYTMSLSEKAKLRGVLESWRGKAFNAQELKGFDMRKVLGSHCMTQVIHTTRGADIFANVDSVTAVPSALKKAGLPEQVNGNIYFSFGYSKEDDFFALPEGIKKIVERSPEYVSFIKPAPAIKSVAKTMDEIDDDIPF